MWHVVRDEESRRKWILGGGTQKQSGRGCSLLFVKPLSSDVQILSSGPCPMNALAFYSGLGPIEQRWK